MLIFLGKAELKHMTSSVLKEFELRKFGEITL